MVFNYFRLKIISFTTNTNTTNTTTSTTTQKVQSEMKPFGSYIWLFFHIVSMELHRNNILPIAQHMSLYSTYIEYNDICWAMHFDHTSSWELVIRVALPTISLYSATSCSGTRVFSHRWTQMLISHELIIFRKSFIE